MAVTLAKGRVAIEMEAKGRALRCDACRAPRDARARAATREPRVVKAGVLLLAFEEAEKPANWACKPMALLPFLPRPRLGAEGEKVKDTSCCSCLLIFGMLRFA